MDDLLKMEASDKAEDTTKTFTNIIRTPRELFSEKLVELIEERSKLKSKDNVKKRILNSRQLILKGVLNHFKVNPKVKVGRRTALDLAIDDIYVCAYSVMDDCIHPDILVCITTNADELIRPSETSMIVDEVQELKKSYKV